jgi:hypothetical protein
MSDIPQEYVASATTRRRIVVTSLLISWGFIAWLILRGNPANSLHESALAWSYAYNILVLFAYSFGTIIKDYFKK